MPVTDHPRRPPGRGRRAHADPRSRHAERVVPPEPRAHRHAAPRRGHADAAHRRRHRGDAADHGAGPADRQPAGRRADPARRARVRRCRPGVAAERRHRFHRHGPQRGHPPARAVRQQAARVARRPAGDRRRPDARHRWFVDRHDRVAARARGARADHRRVRARRSRGHRRRSRRPGCRSISSPRRSTTISTNTPSSSPASATPATASSARPPRRSRRADVRCVRSTAGSTGFPLPDDVPGALWLCGKHHIAEDVDAVVERTGATTVVCLTRRNELAERYPRYVTWLDERTPGHRVTRWPATAVRSGSRSTT